MSRVGKSPIQLPSGVNVRVSSGVISVNGPKGSLEQAAMPGITVKQEDNQITIARANDEAVNRANHGLIRSLVSNMVKGVSEGFERKLELNGVGFRVNLVGNVLKFNL